MTVGIIMGSKSDYEVIKKTEEMLKELGVHYETHVISAHRTPKQAALFAERAEANEFEVIIAAAGKAAHLAGVLAASATVPVIGIPMKTSDFGGLDSLLSTVQMPKGVPVATVAVNGAENAAILAAQMLALKYPKLAQRLKEYKLQLQQDTIDADVEIRNKF